MYDKDLDWANSQALTRIDATVQEAVELQRKAHPNASIEFLELQEQVQVAFEVGGIDHIHHDIGFFLKHEVPGDGHEHDGDRHQGQAGQRGRLLRGALALRQRLGRAHQGFAGRVVCRVPPRAPRRHRLAGPGGGAVDFGEARTDGYP